MKTNLQSNGFSPFDDTDDSVIDFLRRRLPMTLAINTVIALMIALLLRSWEAVVPNLVISYCIGTSILALIASVPCTVMRHFRGNVGSRIGIYFGLVIVGAIIGELFSQLFLGPQDSTVFSLHQSYVLIVCVVFFSIA